MGINKMGENQIKEMVKKAFKEYDKKLVQLKPIIEVLSDYCKGKMGDYEFQEKCEIYKKQEELQKQLDAHWEATADEMKRTHTGKIYEKYMKEKGHET